MFLPITGAPAYFSATPNAWACRRIGFNRPMQRPGPPSGLIISRGAVDAVRNTQSRLAVPLSRGRSAAASQGPACERHLSHAAQPCWARACDASTSAVVRTAPGATSSAPALSSGSLPLPHLGDCGDGQPCRRSPADRLWPGRPATCGRISVAAFSDPRPGHHPRT